MNKQIIIILSLSLLGFFSGMAQDNLFTLYNLQPLLLNPAETGAMVGELRAGAIYRNQWRSVDKPFSTIAAYADKKIFLKGFNLGVGLSILSDRSGPGRLNVVKIAPSVSIQKTFGKHTAIVGIQPSFVHKKLNNVTFPSQYDNSIGGHNIALPSGEAGNSYSKAMFDLNVGVTYILRMKKSVFRFGQAFSHINTPNESLISDSKNKLPVRFTTNASYLHMLSEKLYIKPSVLFMSHNKATLFQIKLLAGYTLIDDGNKEIIVRFGLAYRNNIQNFNGDGIGGNSDAASIIVGATWNKIEFDFAYDINVSNLSNGSSNAGAFELALTYRNLFERKSPTITVPCRRY